MEDIHGKSVKLYQKHAIELLFKTN